jgi:trimethylamine:corrinoid methyltransferase-like protein
MIKDNIGVSMERQIESITKPKLSLNILTQGEVQLIHTATLDVLESVGVKFPSQKALKILKSHGCRVDDQSMIVQFPGGFLNNISRKHLRNIPLLHQIPVWICRWMEIIVIWAQMDAVSRFLMPSLAKKESLQNKM